MKGSYRTRSKGLGYVLIALLLAVQGIVGGICKWDKENMPVRGMIGLVIFTMVIFGLLVLSSMLPCSFETDESGFTLKRFLKTYRYEYDDVAGVRYEYRPRAYRRRPYVKLVVDTHDGRTKKFQENVRYEERSELVKLCAYLNRRC